MPDKPSVLRILHAYTQRNAGFLDDVQARSRILEGAGGLAKWSLSRPRVFFGEGPTQFPNADPAWFDNRRDFGLREAVFAGLTSVLNSRDPRVEELYQDMTSGLTGHKRDDVYASVGEKKSSGILDGSLSPSQVKSSLFAWAKNRALDAVGGPHMVQIQPEVGDQPGFDPSSQVREPLPDDRSVWSVIAAILRSPQAQKYDRWMDRRIYARLTPMHKAIMEVMLEKVKEMGPRQKRLPSFEAIGADPRVYELTKRQEPVSKTAVRKHIIKIRDLIQTAWDTDEEFQQMADAALVYHRLKAANSTRKASAQRVAALYLGAELEEEEETDSEGRKLRPIERMRLRDRKPKDDDKGKGHTPSTDRPKGWSREDEQKYRDYRKDKGRGQGLSPAQWKQRQRPGGGAWSQEQSHARRAGDNEEVPF